MREGQWKGGPSVRGTDRYLNGSTQVDVLTLTPNQKCKEILQLCYEGYTLRGLKGTH